MSKISAQEQASIDYYNNLPAKEVGGGVLIFNQRDELLVVKPGYSKFWAWPNGNCEPGESPWAAAIRECTEETGTCPQPLQPAFVNYIPPRENGRKDVVQFAFIADPVEDSYIDRLNIPNAEIEAVRFMPIDEFGECTPRYRKRGIETYLAHSVAGALLYLHNGLLIGQDPTIL